MGTCHADRGDILAEKACGHAHALCIPCAHHGCAVSLSLNIDLTGFGSGLPDVPSHVLHHTEEISCQKSHLEPAMQH